MTDEKTLFIIIKIGNPFKIQVYKKVLQHSDEKPILFAVGINHKTAAIEAREKIYVSEREIPDLLVKLRETLTECVVLSTCNRTEIYGVTTRTDLDLDFYKNLLIDFKNAGETVGSEHFFGLVSCAACQQLFGIATGIESKIIGDAQILGQLRDSYQIAKAHRATGKILNQLLQRGFKVGKKSRTETALHKGAVSVSSASVEMAAEIFDSLADKTALVIGAGETAQLSAESLLKKRIGKILITNRTRSHAEDLLKTLKKSNNFSGEVIDFASFKKHFNETDIVISSTSASEPIIFKEDFVNQRNKILLIDIAIPRDVDYAAAECENVILRNIDDLNQIVNRNQQRRISDLPKVKRIIMNEMQDFLVWYYSLPFLPDALECGTKPDRKTQTEIVRVKEFLLRNVSQIHKLAMKNGAENFAGHAEVIRHLAEMKRAQDAPGF